MGTDALFWNDKKGMTKLKSIVVIPKLWSGHFLWVRVGVCGVSDDPGHGGPSPLCYFMMAHHGTVEHTQSQTPGRVTARAPGVLSAQPWPWCTGPHCCALFSVIISICLHHALHHNVLYRANHFYLTRQLGFPSPTWSSRGGESPTQDLCTWHL